MWLHMVAHHSMSQAIGQFKSFYRFGILGFPEFGAPISPRGFSTSCTSPFGCIEVSISKCKVSCQGGRKLISGRFGDPCAPCMP